MATDTLLDGESARIITHPRFDRPAVLQHPRRGRLPNSVIKFWKASYEVRCARRLAQEQLEKIEGIRMSIVAHDYFANDYRCQLASLTQTNKAGERQPFLGEKS